MVPMDKLLPAYIKKHLSISIILALIIGSLFFFSFKILDVPPTLTSDEAAFGLNAVLLSETLRDENGRFLPVFVLSLDGLDWRQPITQYYLTGLFKLFGPSVFLLRFSSVIVLAFSTILIYLLANLLFDKKGAILSTVLFLTTPILMIHSHLGLDNIMPIPFALLWLLAVFKFTKTNNRKYLILAGISLGTAFYSYKGMRLVSFTWYLLTLSYLFILHGQNFKRSFKPILIFSTAIFPFFAAAPFLEIRYPGAVFSRVKPSFDSIYDFLYPYFSAFDLTFLYIKGDALLTHSTGKHGFFLLATLPLFLIGIYTAVRLRGFYLFLLLTFFTAPLFYGLVGSVHRASRLMVLIPPYILLSTLGLFGILKIRSKKIKGILIGTFAVLILLNYTDFVLYYWFKYPNLAFGGTNSIKQYESFKALKEESKKRNLKPYIANQLLDADDNKFYQLIYFKPNRLPEKFNQDFAPPKGSIFLTQREYIEGMKKLDIPLKHYYLQTKE